MKGTVLAGYLRSGRACESPEEIAQRLGYITLDKFETLARHRAKSSYGKYLFTIDRSFAKSHQAEFSDHAL